MVQLKIYKDYTALSTATAAEILELVKAKPHAVLCLAAGDTPRLTYSLVAKRATDENVDFSGCTFIGLDEWVGIEPGNEGSCHFFLQSRLFDPLKISDSRIHLFNALAMDLEKECIKMDNIIFAKGGIDLMLVGVGMNGHIGFNEPGVSADKYAHVVELDNITQTVGQKYFKEASTLKKGITLGFRHLQEARKVILQANGTKKAEVIRRTMEGEIHTEMPASIIRTHANGLVMIDEEAASKLKEESLSFARRTKQ